MQYRTFKKTGEEMSLLGFGCMRFPRINEKDPSSIDEKKALEMLDYAYKNGVNYFDTAWFYHGEKSEEFTGRALSAYPRDSFFLATKMPMAMITSREQADDVFEKQFERCQVDYFDNYLFHNMNAEHFELMKKLDLYTKLDEARTEGRIRNLGFSFHDTPEVLTQILDAGDWDFVQIQFNYVDWELQRAKEQYEILEARGIPCIVMEPVRGSRLADLGPESNALLKDENPNASIASWALRWVAEFPNVLVILSGMSTIEQVVENVETLSKPEPLSSHEKQVLDKAVDIYRSYATVPCTACEYCMPCPAGVNIPRMMALYNKTIFDGSSVQLRLVLYPQIPKEERASNCIQCGQCEEACPQKLGIIDVMDKLNAAEARV